MQANDLFTRLQTYTCAVTLISMEGVSQDIRAVTKATVEATEARLMGQPKGVAKKVCKVNRMEINKHLERSVG